MLSGLLKAHALWLSCESRVQSKNSLGATSPWSTQLTPTTLSLTTKILLLQACKSWFSGPYLEDL